jgi:hypothetical protein
MGMLLDVGMGSDPQDIKAVETLLRTAASQAEIRTGKAASGASYHFDAYGGHFKPGSVSIRDGIGDKADTFDKNGRDIGNGGKYYGMKMG